MSLKAIKGAHSFHLEQTPQGAIFFIQYCIFYSLVEIKLSSFGPIVFSECRMSLTPYSSSKTIIELIDYLSYLIMLIAYVFFYLIYAL